MKARKTKLKEINRKISNSRSFYDRLNSKVFMLDSLDFEMHRNTRHIMEKGDSGATTPKVKSVPLSVRLQEALDRISEIDLDD